MKLNGDIRRIGMCRNVERIDILLHCSGIVDCSVIYQAPILYERGSIVDIKVIGGRACYVVRGCIERQVPKTANGHGSG
jgi:hypothetical protein